MTETRFRDIIDLSSRENMSLLALLGTSPSQLTVRKQSVCEYYSTGVITSIVNPVLSELRDSILAAYDKDTHSMDAWTVRNAIDTATDALKKGLKGQLNTGSGDNNAAAEQLPLLQAAIILHDPVPMQERKPARG